MNNIYFTYRRIWDNQTNRYDVSYYNDLQYADYKQAGYTNMLDGNNFIPEDRITKETAPGVKTLRCVGVLQHSEHISGEELKNSLQTVGASFGIEILTAEQMATWIREYTNLQETDTNVFLVADETTDISGEIVPAKYLTIA